jgi:hypothetical protein
LRKIIKKKGACLKNRKKKRKKKKKEKKEKKISCDVPVNVKKSSGFLRKYLLNPGSF